ncbi:MAG: AAA family ATPase [Bacteroidales bacterium]|nr:AAA family ATPase [Bacteroidales bacterium]
MKSENEKYRLAIELVEKTGLHIFLTGKAGTGKTTLLHQLHEKTFKRHIVVAPTGVAAINARGVTLHSFFQLPLRPVLPNELNEKTVKEKKLFHYHPEKQKIIRTIDLLIIDEISMVRADTLDAIDYILRSVRQNDTPFGNVQLLMIGDLYQLPPVVKTEEWQLLSNFYDSPYFFDSQALKKSEYITIELDKVFRQSDDDFVRILNKIREGTFDEDVYHTLQARYVDNFDEQKYKDYVLLTTHNAKAHQINQTKLNELSTEEKTYVASVSGEFPYDIYPTDENLTLKIGAQVMFLRNDLSENRLYYNGKVGKVVELNENYIGVKTAEDNLIVHVEPVTWENIRYSIDPQTKTIKEEIVGVFTQFPLKLAWAITIHKSQGLTFEKVAIDAQNAFAHGQVYVALSRCRSLEGLILLSKINMAAIRLNTNLHLRISQQREAEYSELCTAQKNYLFSLIDELFTFESIEKQWQQCIVSIARYNNDIEGNPVENLKNILHEFKTEIGDVSQKFKNQMVNLKLQVDGSELPPEFQEHIKKAIPYFIEKLTKITDKLIQISFITSEPKIKHKITAIIGNLKNLMAQKKHCLLATKDGFYIEKYLHARAKAELANERQKLNEEPTNKLIPKLKHLHSPELLKKIKAWRTKKAIQKNLKEENIISNSVLIKLSLKPPNTLEELKEILPLPFEYAAEWYKEILEIINNNN